MTPTHESGKRKGTAIYFSHGGGPFPILGDQSHEAMVRFMQRLPSRIAKPDTIIVISAHWEEQEATVLGAAHPTMVYDYYGFPEEAYKITYPAPGHPELARRIVGLFKQNQIAGHIDQERGFDHGLFIPLKLMYPDATIPSIQISLVRGLDPKSHIALGKALRELMNENILVIGSGFSFHNMQAFSWDGQDIKDQSNDAFQNWLIDTCTAPLPQDKREQRLIQWETAPFARYCHPREEHLLPLHVCIGAAGNYGPAAKIFDDFIVGKRSVAFQW
jgi:aromatic ring-opening dioxygenase catalytic subunit (LigB family)